MITVKEAIKAAVAFAEEVLDPAIAVTARLEEVSDEPVGNREAWVLTLSFAKESWMMSTVERVQGAHGREYKTFAVDKETGRVLSMKIRQLAFS